MASPYTLDLLRALYTSKSLAVNIQCAFLLGRVYRPRGEGGRAGEEQRKVHSRTSPLTHGAHPLHDPWGLPGERARRANGAQSSSWTGVLNAAECLAVLSTCRCLGKLFLLQQLFSTGVQASARQPGQGATEGLQTAHTEYINVFSTSQKTDFQGIPVVRR